MSLSSYGLACKYTEEPRKPANAKVILVLCVKAVRSKASVICTAKAGISGAISFLPSCLGISDARYGFITAVFTAGGLIGSLASSSCIEKIGMKKSISLTGFINIVGVVCMFLSPHWIVLAFGRFISGVCAGLSICLVPPFLSSVAQASQSLRSQSGKIGICNQLGIVFGICSAQASGMALTGNNGDKPGSWRWVVLISGVVAAAQIVAGMMLGMTAGDNSSAKAGIAPPDEEAQTAESPLLPAQAQTKPEQPALKSILSSPSLRPPALLCASIMIIQQASGVNAVLFYSARILTSVLPASAGVISVGITFVNAFMTLLPVYLVDRVGRKPLLIGSMTGMCVLSCLIGLAIDSGWKIVSSVAITLFIAMFAIGMGPIPFLLISELVPGPAIPAVSSLSLSCSWITNFTVAVSFLPLRGLLSSTSKHGQGREGEGRVFYVFGAILAVAVLGIGRAYKA